MADGVVVGGQVYPVMHPDTRHPVPVFSYSDTVGIRVPAFRAGDGYNKKRSAAVDLCVWHWTGGEAEPDRVAETLRRRKLGVEFAISRQGNIFQFCDPALVDTADAGIVNSRSVGVEVVCYGFSGQFTLDPVRAVRVPVVPRLGKDRGIYLAQTHGRVVRTAKFYPAQVAAACALADALSAALRIPRRVPPAEVEGVYPPVLARDESRFQGHCGHYHVTEKKRDPGPDLMAALDDHFAEAA